MQKGEGITPPLSSFFSHSQKHTGRVLAKMKTRIALTILVAIALIPFATAPPVDVTDQLVQHYTFDNGFDDDVGSNDLTNLGGPVNITSFSFQGNGSADLDSDGPGGVLQGSQSFTQGDNDRTYNLWVWHEGDFSTNTDYLVSAGQFPTLTGEAYTVNIKTASGSPNETISQIGADLQGDAVLAVTLLPEMSWLMITVQYEASTMNSTIYVNGSVIKTGTHGMASFLNGTDFRVGCNINGCAESGTSNNIIDDLRLYNKKLTQTEIDSLFVDPNRTMTFMNTVDASNITDTFVIVANASAQDNQNYDGFDLVVYNNGVVDSADSTSGTFTNNAEHNAFNFTAIANGNYTFQINAVQDGIQGDPFNSSTFEHFVMAPPPPVTPPAGRDVTQGINLATILIPIVILIGIMLMFITGFLPTVGSDFARRAFAIVAIVAFVALILTIILLI